MVSLFKTKAKNHVGVDIGTSFVKLLELSRSGKGYKVDSYGIVHLPEGAVIDNNVQDIPAVADVVERAARVGGCKSKSAVTSVPSSGVISRTLEFSREFTEDELEEQIRVEADQYIPYSMDEVAIDFEVRGPSPDDPALNDVILVACRQDSVQSREDSVNGAGLTCEVVDVDTYALERAYPILANAHELEDKTTGLIDIGASSMALYVFQDNKIIYNREQVFGGNDLTHNLSQATDMTPEEIEQTKKSGDFSDELMQGYVEPFKQATAQQIARSLQFYYSSGSHAELDVILLAGGVASLPGLAAAVEQELGTSTYVANPFKNMAMAGKIKKSKFDADASSLVLACGLALRDMAD